MSSTETPTFFGWWRQSRGVEWQRLSEGETEGAAFNSLLDAIARQKGGESIILPADRHPDQGAGRKFVAGGKRLL